MGLDMYLTARILKNDPDPRAQAVFEVIDEQYPQAVPDQYEGEGVALWTPIGDDPDPRQVKAVREVIANRFPAVNTENWWISGYFTKANVTLPLAYWRKANQIHAWFVEHVQLGADDCGSYEVKPDKLFELRKTVKRVLGTRSLAPKLLAPREGFFFGSYGYDDWYFDNLETTLRHLDRLCVHGLTERATIHYHSSW